MEYPQLQITSEGSPIDPWIGAKQQRVKENVLQ